MCFSSPKIPETTVTTPQTAKEANSAALLTAAAEARRSGATANKQLRTGPGGVASQTSSSLTSSAAENTSLLGG